jgi:hypothetical protein
MIIATAAIVAKAYAGLVHPRRIFQQPHRAAMEAVEGWVFAPATLWGRPVRACGWVAAYLCFALRRSPGWVLLLAERIS